MFLLLVFHKFLDLDWRFTLKINADIRAGLSVPRKLILCGNYFVNMLFSYSSTLNVMLFWCILFYVQEQDFRARRTFTDFIIK